MEGGLNPVDLSSDIGTWTAAALAIIALVGIIGPYLAFRASLSDTNRAMNAVRDVPQKYITRGIKLTRNHRVFRRTHVPNLSPTYITNDPEKASLISSTASSGLWILGATKYDSWNSGWAKLAELIETYRFLHVEDDTRKGLGVSKGGSLEVVNSRTALVVHKQWFLLLGLLGRYGQRKDQGIIQTTNIRRDFRGERIGLSGLLYGRVPPVSDYATSTESYASRSESRSGDSKSEHEDCESESGDYDYYDSGPSSQLSESGLAVLDGNLNIEARRRPWGSWAFEYGSKPIHGVTGTLQYLGRHKGNYSYLDTISFTPHTASEMFDVNVTEKQETVSLQTLFWLAHGFLPSDRAFEGRCTVICLEDPTDGIDKQGSMLREDIESPLFVCLQNNESEEIPVLMGHALYCLGIPDVGIRQYQLTQPSVSELQAISEGDNNKNEIQIIENWIKIPMDGNTKRYFHKSDIEATLSAFFHLEWDPWGYLIWKGRDCFFKDLLRSATSTLRNRKILRNREILQSITAIHDIAALDWKVQNTFHAKKTRDYLVFEQHLRKRIQDTEVQPLCVALGTLFILDDSFRKVIEALICLLAKRRPQSDIDREGNENEGSNEASGSGGEQGSNSTEADSKPIGGFFYDYETKELQWTPQERAGSSFLKETIAWTVHGDLIRAPHAQAKVAISAEEIVTVGLWAANRAAIWLSAQDSQYLLKFMDELDAHIYVL